MSVEAAYAEVERITRREARNFAYGIMVLPKAKRQAIAAIYAFARRVDDIAAGRVTPEWQALLRFQASRARAYMKEGLELLDSLDSRSAACVGTFAGLYRATLDRIEARGYDVFDGSLRLSPLTKLRIVGAGLLR